MPHLIAGVEDVAPVTAGNQAVLGVHVGEVGYLRGRVALGNDGANRRLEGAEALAEGDLLRVGEALAGEQQHRVLVEGVSDFPERPVVDPFHVHAEDLDAEPRVEWSRGQGHPWSPSGATRWRGIGGLA